MAAGAAERIFERATLGPPGIAAIGWQDSCFG
jgi:hypothetical protein